jgi:hypothetical protein
MLQYRSWGRELDEGRVPEGITAMLEELGAVKQENNQDRCKVCYIPDIVADWLALLLLFFNIYNGAFIFILFTIHVMIFSVSQVV